ncbi:MAG: NAD(P)/FAD-dependent oxidoreductase [Acidobacteriota bacterium]|jgi:phytoene dehydrogenase-like protein
MAPPDHIVVGSGPNGLAAAVALVRAGRSVHVVEGAETLGGGCRTAELTLPGFLHDVCSAVHPLTAGSPFLSTLPLAEHGLELLQPEIPLAHPFDDGTAAVLARSVEETGASLDEADRDAYRRLVSPFVTGWDRLVPEILAPLHLPRAPVLMARFGLRGVRSASGLARSVFAGPRARGLFAGLAAHSMLPLDRPPSAAIGLVLAVAGHAVGWPIPRGGARSIAGALVSLLEDLGGTVETGRWVRSLEDLPELPHSRSALFDVTPRQLLEIAGDALPAGYRRRLARFRYGPGVFKVDWALDGPIPWRAAACKRAGTLHLGGTLEEIAASEAAAWEGRPPDRPYVLIAQPTLTDPSRLPDGAPEGRHVAWGYCHVPSGWDGDATEAIERQVERFAPGFRDRTLGRHTMTAPEMEAYNPNTIGGDINGGAATLGQLVFRPVARWTPYATPNPRIWLCSSSTPPGGGVHGMCGYHAARAVLGVDRSTPSP